MVLRMAMRRSSEPHDSDCVTHRKRIVKLVGVDFLMALSRTMTESKEDPATGIKAFKSQAEVLVVHQLDLLAQIEAQLRAVHRTMRRIRRSARGKVSRRTVAHERGARCSVGAIATG
jgi:Ni2+-binding GTPase involved in maturation of urease and hydrogenase